MNEGEMREKKKKEIFSNFVFILKKLVSFQTISGTPNTEAVEWIGNYLEQYGVTVRRYKTDYNANIENLYSCICGSKKGGLCFSGHLDVVPPQHDGWTQDPFTVFEKDHRFYGRGTTDMKGFLSIILAMVPYWSNEELEQPIHISITYDEEIGCRSVPLLIDEFKKDGIKPDAVILGEPTECVPIGAHKGGAECSTEIRGLSAHASKPDTGYNSIYYAMDYIRTIRDFQKNFIASNCENVFIDPPYTTLSVGTIIGGVARNIIPDVCKFEWEVRTLPGESAEDVVRAIEDENRNAVSKEELEKISINTVIEDSYPGLILHENSKAIEWVRKMRCQSQVASVSFGTEAGYYDQAGMSTVVWGPGSIKRAHIVDEYIEEDQVNKYIDYLLNL